MVRALYKTQISSTTTNTGTGEWALVFKRSVCWRQRILQARDLKRPRHWSLHNRLFPRNEQEEQSNGKAASAPIKARFLGVFHQPLVEVFLTPHKWPGLFFPGSLLLLKHRLTHPFLSAWAPLSISLLFTPLAADCPYCHALQSHSACPLSPRRSLRRWIASQNPKCSQLPSARRKSPLTIQLVLLKRGWWRDSCEKKCPERPSLKCAGQQYHRSGLLLWWPREADNSVVVVGRRPALSLTDE